jgi:hypothetical protein
VANANNSANNDSANEPPTTTSALRLRFRRRNFRPLATRNDPYNSQFTRRADKKQRRRQLPPKSLLLNRRTTTMECMKSQTTKSTANRSRKSLRRQQTTPRNVFEISRNKTYLYYLMISLMCELMSKNDTYMFLQFFVS